MEGKEAMQKIERVVDQWKPYYHMCRVGRTNAEKKSISLEEDPQIQQQLNGREGGNAEIKRVVNQWKPHYYMCRVSHQRRKDECFARGGSQDPTIAEWKGKRQCQNKEARGPMETPRSSHVLGPTD